MIKDLLGILFYGAIAALMLIAVVRFAAWPTRAHGRRLLVRWGLPDPSDEEADLTVAYLCRRRVLSAIFLAVVNTAVGILQYEPGRSVHRSLWGTDLLVPAILAGLVVGELVNAVRPARAVHRTALLAPRRLWDVAPRWALSLFGLVLLAAIGYAVLDSALRPAAAVRYDRPQLLDPGPDRWVLVCSLACLLAVGAVVVLAARRPAVPDPRVDPVLRVRSTRYALGLGLVIGWFLLAYANSQFGLLVRRGSGTTGWRTLVLNVGPTSGFLLAAAILLSWLLLVRTARPAVPAAVPR